MDSNDLDVNEQLEEVKAVTMNRNMDNHLFLSKSKSFQQNSIELWSSLQEKLLLEFSILYRYSETKTEKVLSILSHFNQFIHTSVNYKKLSLKKEERNKETSPFLVLSPIKLFESALTYIQTFLQNLTNNSFTFAQLLYSSYNNTEINQIQFDDMIYNIVNFIYDPIVGMGFGAGLFGFLRELLEMDIKNCSKVQEYFDKNTISMKFLLAFSRRFEGSLYLSNILLKPIKELLSNKQILDLNAKSIYENLLLKKKQKEAKEKEYSKNKKDKKDLGVFRKFYSLIGNNNKNATLQATLQEVSLMDVSEIQKKQQKFPRYQQIREQIVPQLELQFQPLDQQILEEVIQIVDERRTQVQSILTKLMNGIINGLDQIPLIIRVIAKLLMQVLKEHFSNVSVTTVLTSYIISKWVIPEFTVLFLNTYQSQFRQDMHANISIISKYLHLIWRGTEIEGIEIPFTQQDVENYCQKFLALPEHQLKILFQKDEENHINCFIISLNDLQQFINIVLKNKQEFQPNLKKQADYIQNLAKSCQCNFMNLLIENNGQMYTVNDVYIAVTKMSDKERFSTQIILNKHLNLLIRISSKINPRMNRKCFFLCNILIVFYQQWKNQISFSLILTFDRKNQLSIEIEI